jgi:hypothetical protein
MYVNDCAFCNVVSLFWQKKKKRTKKVPWRHEMYIDHCIDTNFRGISRDIKLFSLEIFFVMMKSENKTEVNLK